MVCFWYLKKDFCKICSSFLQAPKIVNPENSSLPACLSVKLNQRNMRKGGGDFCFHFVMNKSKKLIIIQTLITQTSRGEPRGDWGRGTESGMQLA